MRFTKMQGIGNDYIYVDGGKELVPNASEMAVRVSDRHFGVGSDGLILINPSESADFEMEMYNADGSRGKMCGNGIRCVGKYVYDHGLTDKTVLRIGTLSGIKTLQLSLGDDGKVSSVRVDMGEAILTPSEIPVDLSLLDAGSRPEDPGAPLVRVRQQFGERPFEITCVSMGNPHCVLFLKEEIASLKLEDIGPVFEHAPLFPEGVNTEFINVLSRDHLAMRVWERGSSETQACGTGACAAAVAAVLNGLADRSLTVSLLGGDLEIEWDESSGHVFMTGPAVEVFSGTFE